MSNPILNNRAWVSLALVLVAFAANSLLNRLALTPLQPNGELAIDPISFTLIRLVAGAVMLSLLVILSGKKLVRPNRLQFRGAIFLFAYAVAFSCAYINLGAAIGALILFAMVQISILCVAAFEGKKLLPWEWFGSAMAMLGLVILTLPSILGATGEGLVHVGYMSFVFMVISGIAWGLYTVNGAASKDALLDTTMCFILSLPLIVLATVLASLRQDLTISINGIALAICSGAFASGLGYALWYRLLPQLSKSQAATSQLLVPVIAAAGGFVLLDERLGFSFLLASLFILGGVFMVARAQAEPAE